MRTTVASLLIVVAILLARSEASPSPSDTYSTGTVYYNSDTNDYTLKLGVVDVTGAAFGFYNDTIETTGWGILQIETSSTYPDNVQTYAAGYLEAALTQPRVYQMYNNLFSFYWPQGDTVPSDVAEFFSEQDQWMRDQISLNQNDDYWQAVSIILSQYDGFVAGYQANDGGSPLNITAFQVLNGAGDLLDLIPALNVSNRVQWHKLSPEEFRIKSALNGHCSALVKVTGDYSDMFMGHSAWFIYSSMLRIFKYYNFNLNSNFVAAKSLAFSSYPGFLESLDDFYMMSSNVVMLQTTNSIFNMELYDLVVPQSLLAWHRVRVANMISNNGPEWAAAVSQYNSGTYNNQYMVIDTKEFHPGQPLGSNILWVVEQIPGLVESADMSDTLSRGYWPSYNVPYFPSIYNQSGYPEIVEKYGYDNSYQMAPRAQIFRRDQGTVDSWETFHSMMRYNNFENDPYSNGNPGYAICSRFDLGTNPVAAGCIDTKITSYTRSQSLFAAAINGPTTGDGNLPPFDWSEFPTTPHYGEPQLYDFSFVSMFPQWPSLTV